jgi:tetratricopeptide (TPR) repeat protein
MQPQPVASELSVLVDSELESSGPRARLRPPPPGAPWSPEAVEPFLRALEALVAGLAQAVGEAGPARLAMGSLVVEFSSPGWGDGAVRAFLADHPPAGAPGALEPAGEPERPGDTWEQAVAAAREGCHSEALGLFEAEAEEAVAQGEHQRAALADGGAGRRAEAVGRYDHANKLLRLAGKHYLFVAESPDTPSRGVLKALVTAAKCFLQAGNLPLAGACITRALAASETLSDLA